MSDYDRGRKEHGLVSDDRQQTTRLSSERSRPAAKSVGSEILALVVHSCGGLVGRLLPRDIFSESFPSTCSLKEILSNPDSPEITFLSAAMPACYRIAVGVRIKWVAVCQVVAFPAPVWEDADGLATHAPPILSGDHVFPSCPTLPSNR